MASLLRESIKMAPIKSVGIVLAMCVMHAYADVVAFKDAAKLKSWDAWNDHKPATPKLRSCVTWEKLNQLDPGIRQIGRLAVRGARDIKSSKWSVGCETMDRDYADWNAYKQFLEPLGAKHGRLFSGWAKTEQEKGKYDFSWLDLQVREMAAMGVKPWICLSYGNPVYGSDFRLGMRVKQVTDNPESFEAWLKYCTACVERYKDVVDEWEIWNEPFDQGPEYAEMFYRTAKAIHAVQPMAKCICTAITFPGDYKCVLQKLKDENALGLGSYFIYHPYIENPDLSYDELAEPLRRLVKSYLNTFDIMQGESGCPSQLEFAHALHSIEWTEYSQAKWNLRRAIGDAARSIPSNLFTMIDLQYTFMLQSFGLIRSNALKEPVYRRPSYYAMQNVYAIFDDEMLPQKNLTVNITGRDVTCSVFSRHGQNWRFYWFSDRQPSSDLAFATVDLSIPEKLDNLVWIDMITGRVFEISDDAIVQKRDGITVKGVPLWDSPIAIVARKAVVLADDDASANLFPNPSFEVLREDGMPETDGWKWSATLVDDYGNPLFAHIGASDAAAHSGRYSFHMRDASRGRSDEVCRCALPKDAIAPFRGKGLKFSAWVKLEGKSGKSQVGIGAICTSKESALVSASADFPKEVTRTEGFERLCCYLKIPEDAKSISLVLRCSNGWFTQGEAYFDDCELRVVPREAVPETAEEREKRLRKPFVPDKSAIAWAEEWMRPMCFEDDGRKRPAIRGGNLVNEDGSFFYPVGVWVWPGSERDWNERVVAKHGIKHPAYTMPPGKAVFDIVGCNSAQISYIPVDIALASRGYVNAGRKDFADVVRHVDGIRKHLHDFEDVWMSVDFAQCFFQNKLKLVNGDLFERIDQRHRGWNAFVPFCPECPEGRAYYHTFFRTGTKLALASNLNVGLWELFNESVYGCECEYNKRDFARRAAVRYGTVEAANAAWGTEFSDFDELARVADFGQFKGLWSEWCAFLATRYAEVLAEGIGVIREIDRRPNVYFTEQLAFQNVWNGMMDYRRIADALDALSVEGGWGYGGGTDGVKAKDELEAVVFAGSRHWYILDFFQALTRGRKPVFNHEHYCTRLENANRVPSRAMDYVTSMWLEFFHGLAGSQFFCWEKRAPEWTTFEEAKANVLSPSYKSSAMLNPYNWPTNDLNAFWRFRREFEKYQNLISEFPRTTSPRVAIYHSQTTAAMAPKFGRPIEPPMSSAYAAVLHALYPVTFVFDDELTEWRLPKGIEAIVVPAADFETESVRKALEAFAAHGGTVVADRRAFSFDEHGRAAKGPPSGAVVYDAGPTNAAPILAALEAAGVRKTGKLVPLDGLGDVLGADVQVIDRGDFKLILVVNMVAGGAERRVRLSLPIEGKERWTVTNAVTDMPIPAPDGGMTWTSQEMVKGVEVLLPYQERVLVAVRMAR